MTRSKNTVAIKRLGTGDTDLDELLGGGIPERSVTVVAGEPGSGKTIFALQLLFHFARQGKKSLYFTTLSEPALKLIRYMQIFTFFDRRMIDERILFADLGASLRSKGSHDLLDEIVQRVEQDEPEVVVIDSFKAVHDLLGTTRESREFVYDLSVRMSGWGATTFLLGEYTSEEVATQPEFAIADGIIRLTNRRQELTAVREMEVSKLRGANYVTGGHFFEIGAGGLRFYPRVRGPEVKNGKAGSIAERATSGIEGLDDLLRGGFPRGSSTLIQGGSGTGKTLIGLHFLVEGARRGEPGILFTMEETPEQLHDIARGFGWDLPALEAQGVLKILYTSPIELSTDRFLHEMFRAITVSGARRVMLDSLSSARLGVASERRFNEFSYAMTKHFRAAGVTALLSMEITELLGTAQLTGHGISSITDNVVMLRYVEVAGHLERAISVLKARGVAHKTELRRMAIASKGVEVGTPYAGVRGVLTGLPVPIGDTADGGSGPHEGG